MINFEELVWLKPLAKPRESIIQRTFDVRFVPESFEPEGADARGGYAEIRDREIVKRVRRQLRREQRLLVKSFGSLPRVYRESPFWWTPKTSKLVVIEVCPPRWMMDQLTPTPVNV